MRRRGEEGARNNNNGATRGGCGGIINFNGVSPLSPLMASLPPSLPPLSLFRRKGVIMVELTRAREELLDFIRSAPLRLEMWGLIPRNAFAGSFS